MKFEEKICCVVKSWTKIEKETETKGREKKKKANKNLSPEAHLPTQPTALIVSFSILYYLYYLQP